MMIRLTLFSPVMSRQLKEIQKNIYTLKAPLRAEILPSEEPIPFEALRSLTMHPLRPGDTWGRKLACAWLHLSGQLPPGTARPVVLIANSGEGLIYTAGGEPVTGISQVWVPQNTPHHGGRFREVPLGKLCKPGLQREDASIDFYADYGFNGRMMIDWGKARFGGAYIASRDEAAYGYYYDYLSLFLLAAATEDKTRQRDLAAALKGSYRQFKTGGGAAGRQALAGPLHETSTSELAFNALGHGHLDLAWLWPIRETKRKAARTYSRALLNIENYPGYVYGTSQPQQLVWLREQYPAIYRGVKQAIAQGRIEMQGGFWVECDAHLSGGESLIRQALYGRRFIETEFGRDMKICWLPDAFGFSAALPQILRGCGMEYFSTIKLAWNKVNVFPHRSFWWQGIDGSRVLAHMPPEGDYNSTAQAGNILRAVKQYPEKHLGRGLLVYGAGDGGGGPDETHLELLARQQNLGGLPRILQSSALDFFEELKQRAVSRGLETYCGELYLETHQGTYTTQAKNKYYNRLCETLLHNAETLSVLTGLSSADKAALDEIWQELLLYQFHDIIPGSSIGRVNREALAGYERMEARLRELIAGRLTALGPPEEPAAGPSLVNLSSFDRDEYLRIDGGWYHAQVPPYAAAAASAAPGPFPALAAGDDSLSNGLLSLRFGRYGEIISCLDAGGRELAAGSLNELILFSDPFDIPFNAWNINPRYRSMPKRRLRPYASETAIEGPQAVRINRYRFGKSSAVQKVILQAGSDTALFETELDWHETHRMLRAEFFPADYGDTVKCEIQFGYIERSTTEKDSVEKAQFEVCAHRWVAVEKDGRGFALLNNCKYGHRAKKGLLSLNLLRSTTFPDRDADRGIQRFTYGFCPFETRPGGLAKLIREAYRLNQPLIPAPSGPFASLVRVSDPAVIIETLKMAEDGGGTLLRLYESLGREAAVCLETRIPHGAVHEADMLENCGNTVDLGSLRFRPFEIKTLILSKE